MQAFPLRHSTGKIKLIPAQIIRIESSSNYSRIHFTNRSPLLVCKILQWFEDLLPNEDFVRVHRSHLVNRSYISAQSGDHYLLLEGGELVPVSRRRRKAVG